MNDTNPVYYRVYAKGRGRAIIVTMQPFDEYDYNQDCFITERKFDTEIAARAWCYRVCESDNVPEYIKDNVKHLRSVKLEEIEIDID